MSSLETHPPIKHVVAVGGTHGNEMSGVCLARYWLKDPSELQRESFSATSFLSNTQAAERCLRYVDQDLNRCFQETILDSSESFSLPYEVARAKEINKTLGPKGSSEAPDFIFDMHNTTANMGSTFILGQPGDHLTLHMMKYMQEENSDSPCFFIVGKSVTAFLGSIAKRFMVVELGPQPQGVIRADQLVRMRHLVASGLDFIDLFNKGTEFPAFEADIFQPVDTVNYPRDASGQITAVVHPERQDKDFVPLNPGDPIFQTLSGETIAFCGNHTVFPLFVNEAAYYEKGVAFWIAEKRREMVPAVGVNESHRNIS
ncbi:N-acyl-aromatic-L-amino acid amidohydrolase (carboxylate-forming) [Latimeria chalumnae]|uniref:N-acyl-aromatic-L-amino acid amidohydrolase n=1 Tax=Latimeria chalumnae TaxID=7897 RepID=H3A3X5_LATCH|nr:PREDICTED: N-acyl-aromatic-L-amino acid amidohydrolase (carboxylate-forming)-like [Latimeria chalumnae]|eukprot:XP_005999316.1 PREDICTED: N-acyl-aromatic-L-amino acid amidohydrolase (carboxylate-forming)-like [Latimeria chalumnae]